MGDNRPVLTTEKTIETGIVDAAEEIRAKQTGILDTIIELCGKEGFPVILIEETALSAFRDGRINDYPVIAMRIGDAFRLADSQQLRDAGLRADSAVVTPAHQIFTMEIYDPGTIDFNAGELRSGKNKYMHVRVKLLKDAEPGKIAAKLCSMEIVAYRKLNAAGGAAAGLIRGLVKTYGGLSGKVSISDKVFPARVFTSPDTVSIGGSEYLVPADTAEYLKKMYGAGWREYSVKQYTESKTAFRDIHHSWDEYAGRISNWDFDGYIRARDSFRVLNKEFREASDRVESYYAILVRTHARIMMWKKYHSSKAEILKLAGEKKYDELGTLLDEYIEEIIKLSDKGLGLCFDPEIFDAACEVLRYRGLGDIADKAASLVPEAHRKPFVLLDYKGEPADL